MAGPHSQRDLTVAVIGAGIAGLACARELAEAGVACTVFEKSRGVGGRMATRRAGELRFDHGGRYFKAEGREMRAAVAGWRRAGVTAEWRPRDIQGGPALPPERFVGVPAMNSLARFMAENVRVCAATRVASVGLRGRGWRVADDGGGALGEFDAVLVTAPAPQAAPLLVAAPALAEIAAGVTFQPCWAVLVAFDGPVPVAGDALRGGQGAVSWVAREASKPGRPRVEAWVLHASTEWTAERLEASPEVVGPELVRAFAELIGGTLPAVIYMAAHRWRFARPARPAGVPCLWDRDLRLGAAGDWCLGRGVEAAYDSGRAAARCVLAVESTGSPG